MAGSWKEPLEAPFGVGRLVLLTDGSVLAQQAQTCLWWRLRPDRAGRYRFGEWKRAGISKGASLDTATAVLADGSVIMAGGFAGKAGAAERYDSVAETWQDLEGSPDWTGAPPVCVLADGRLLIGDMRRGSCFTWGGAAADWARPKAWSGHAASETWLLLADGTVLAIGRIRDPVCQRFAKDAWNPPGGVNGDVGDAAKRIAAAMLLPDGTVFVLAADGSTAQFIPDPDPAKPGGWVDWPSLPEINGAAQRGEGAQACLLPDGRVLCVLRSQGGGSGLVSAVFDPADKRWGILTGPETESRHQSGSCALLVLPTGQVLVSDGTRSVQVFQPEPGPEPAWQPSVENVSASLVLGNKERLQGFRITGVSQASGGGSHPPAATNYPIVRLRAAPPSDTALYCRTGGHSSMGVAERGLQETSFTVPADTSPGIYYLCVVANGVASTEVPVHLSAGRHARRPDGVRVDKRGIFGEEELFLRDLSEVHLLMDFISGRADKSLSGLTDISLYDMVADKLVPMTPQRVVEEICKISYPPQGTLEANAHQAAFMLTVKDKLNYLAAPARGLSVAFTAMYSGVAIPYPEPKAPSPGQVSQQQFFSAKEAYPNLEREARRFRALSDRLPYLAFALVLFTAYTNWDLSMTSTVLQQIDVAEKTYLGLFASDKKFLPTGANCGQLLAPPANAAAKVDAPAAGPAVAQPRNDPPLADFSEQIAICGQRDKALADLGASRGNLQSFARSASWYRPVGMSLRLFGPKSLPPIQDAAKSPTTHGQEPVVERSEVEDFLLAVVTGLTSIVIPTAFGALGTLAGLMRSITNKVRDSVLAPRDYQISRVSVPLGMTAGLAVGLFFNSADPGGALSKSLGSTITLTAAGLSFLAGFGAEAFFSFLGDAILRLMPPSQPQSGPPGQGR